MFYRSLLLPDLRMSLDENDRDGVREFCLALHAAIVAEVLAELSPEDLWKVLSSCDAAHQAEIFSFLEPNRQIEIVDIADRKELTKLLEEMAADERVDFLNRLDEEHVEAILPLMAQAERTDIRKLLSYPESSAGALMTTEYASLPASLTVAEAFDQLQRQAPDSETIYYIYIVNDERRLNGIVTIRQLILAKRTAKLSDIMRRDVLSVRVDDDKEFVASEMARYDFIAIPVVDNQNRLCGIVTHDDAIDVIQDEAQEDAMRQAAVQPLEESYMDTPLLVMARKRGVWLVVLLCAAFGNAALLKRYEWISEQYKWLQFFVPLVLASGGNAGSQAATLVIREIHGRTLSRREKISLVFHELRVALILGVCMMLVALTGAFGLVPRLEALIVGLTVFSMVFVGTLTGSSLPILFKQLGMDPALMSNPLIAALSDLIGVFVFYHAALYLVG